MAVLSRALLLAPHGDDETLFASFLCLRHRPHVVVVLYCGEEREAETKDALDVLGCTWRQWHYPEASPDWEEIEDRLRIVASDYDHCFAPALEQDGHEQHGQVAELARHVFGKRVTSYLTYRRGHGRTVGTPVEFEPHWPALKLRALACYESQIANPLTRDWFLGPQYEYVR